jgi:hypothetical protein
LNCHLMRLVHAEEFTIAVLFVNPRWPFRCGVMVRRGSLKRIACCS